jgi:hypothetical protein
LRPNAARLRSGTCVENGQWARPRRQHNAGQRNVEHRRHQQRRRQERRGGP